MLHDTFVLQQYLNPPRVIVNGIGLQELVMSKLPYAKRHAYNIHVTIKYIHVTSMHVVTKKYVSGSICLRSFTDLAADLPSDSHHQMNHC